MNISSISFIFGLLPVFVLIHAFLKGKLRNAFLFIGSLVFYALACGEHYEWIVLLLVSVVMNYLLGLLIAATSGAFRRVIFIFGVAYNVVVLGLYKYFDTLIGWVSPTIPPELGLDLSSVDMLLPLGMSFYTFKNLSYLHEVYAEETKEELSFLNYGTYLMLFPQISMGPIQTYKSFRPYLIERTVTLAGINEGVTQFIFGLAMKSMLANRLGSVWNGIEVIGYDGISTPLAWLGIFSFALQLYFDFCGYSMMASGIGKMLGYETPKNFDHPYLATSMSDFWRRWHMTLGAWFKENVYFPMGGNRYGLPRQLLNMLVVWVLTGIWHGDTLMFVLWGLFLFAIVAIEKTKVLNKITSHKVFSHVYMIPLILFSWLLFRLPSVKDLGVYLSRLVPFFTETPDYVYAADWVPHVKGVGVLLVLGILFCTPLPEKLYGKIRHKTYLTVPILLILFWYAVYLVACGANDPFLYANY